MKRKALIGFRDVYRVSSLSMADITLELINTYYNRVLEENNPLDDLYLTMVFAVLSTSELNETFRIETDSRKRIYDELERLEWVVKDRRNHEAVFNPD